MTVESRGVLHSSLCRILFQIISDRYNYGDNAVVFSTVGCQLLKEKIMFNVKALVFRSSFEGFGEAFPEALLGGVFNTDRGYTVCVVRREWEGETLPVYAQHSLLMHELTHLFQMYTGEIDPSVQEAGVLKNPGLELEAFANQIRLAISDGYIATGAAKSGISYDKALGIFTQSLCAPLLEGAYGSSNFTVQSILDYVQGSPIRPEILEVYNHFRNMKVFLERV